MSDIEMPWGIRSRQQSGMKSEKKLAKEAGARLHPRSGAGKIKDDASNEETIFEFKEVAKSHSLSGQKLEELLVRAIQQNKTAQYDIVFLDNNLTFRGTIQRGV